MSIYIVFALSDCFTSFQIIYIPQIPKFGENRRMCRSLPETAKRGSSEVMAPLRETPTCHVQFDGQKPESQRTASLGNSHVNYGEKRKIDAIITHPREMSAVEKAGLENATTQSLPALTNVIRSMVWSQNCTGSTGYTGISNDCIFMICWFSKYIWGYL